MKKSFRKSLLAAVLLCLLSYGVAFADTIPPVNHSTNAQMVAGPQPDGTGVTPNGWKLTPAGKQLELGNYPLGGALSPDGRYLIASNDGTYTQELQVINVQSKQVVQTITYSIPKSIYLGVAFSPDGTKVYVSAAGDNVIRVYNFANGQLIEESPIPVTDPNSTDPYPAGISISPDGTFLYVANQRGDSVSSINLSTGKEVTTTAVGHNPYTTLVSKDGNTVYVSNWGERTVTVLDAKTLTVKKTINVGLHPNAMALNPVNGLIYVADSDSDQISVIDPNHEQVVQTISLAPYHNAPTGSVPDALTVSPDGKTLYVANARNDDIAAVDIGHPHAIVKGLIPTAWYPSGVYVAGSELLVLNAKGLGTGPNNIPLSQKPVPFITSGSVVQHFDGQVYPGIHDIEFGTMSFIPIPDTQQLNAYTKQVEANNRVKESAQSVATWSTESQQIQQKFPIKHVILVIKENKTYDQVFGDIGKGNSDPTWAQNGGTGGQTGFGEQYTPNEHALANQFVLYDNYYVDGESSKDGHNFLMQAMANDYVQVNRMAADTGKRNRGGDDLEGDSPVTHTAGGFLWDDAAKSGVSYRDYGEFAQIYDSTTGQWLPDDSNDPAVLNNYDPNYPGWTLQDSDLSRFNEWNKEFQQFAKNGNLPGLETVLMPTDHTGGAPGSPTPQAQVAQNDYALGELVDAVSHSQYWKNTAIVVAQDDPQSGIDHVDAHRSPVLVISPYTQTGKIDSSFYDMMSVLKTIELPLGMKPMSQLDAAATPMFGSFTTKPNFAPYTVQQPQYPLNSVNP